MFCQLQLIVSSPNVSNTFSRILVASYVVVVVVVVVVTWCDSKMWNEIPT